MTRVRHLNCGYLHAPPGPRVGCHCLLLDDPAGLALIDTGIGRHDIADPAGRVGPAAIAAAGFQFVEADTAVRQIETRRLRPADVAHVALTHADPDHAGGLSDFPNAAVHLSAEELAAVSGGDPRYSAAQFAHGPRWRPHGSHGSRDWFGLEARPLPLGFAAEVLLVPLFGHSAGHCGVAVRQSGGRWLLHAGDAYYLRAELADDEHPAGRLAAARAADDGLRRQSLDHLRRLARDHAAEVVFFGYHDLSEMPAAEPPGSGSSQPTLNS